MESIGRNCGPPAHWIPLFRTEKLEQTGVEPKKETAFPKTL